MAGKSTGGITGLADRYATALFELALERTALDAVEDDLATLQALLDESADLRALVRSPVISRADQAKAMAAIVARAGLTGMVGNFIALLARNRRLFALGPAIAAFRAKLAAQRGEVSAEVTSAATLKPHHLAAVKDALRAIVGRDVALETKVDAALIGGLVVRVGSRMIDNSIRTKLQNLELAMKGI